jgi:hypothetical protein
MARRTGAGQEFELNQEQFMRYMMLIYTITEVWSCRICWASETRKRGMLVAVNSLGRTDTATTVRVENGKVLTIDGPFAETKEQLAGYYVLDCTDLNEAIAWAARIPTSCGGTKGSIEIRQLGELPAVPESILKPHPVTVNASRD